MKNTMKKLSAFAMIALAAGLMTGCSGNNTNEPSNNDGTNDKTENNNNNNNENNGNKNPETTEGNTFVFEFEDLDFSQKSSSGLSGAAQGWELVTKATGFGINVPAGTEASNGYFAGYTYEAGFTYDFEVTASAATTATMVLRMNSEIGNFELGPNHGLAINVNNSALDYTPVTVTVGKDVNGIDSLYAFADYTISAPVTLAEGKNTINFTILAATVSRGQIAPLMDCMKLSVKDSATLTFSNNYQEQTHRGYEAD